MSFNIAIFEGAGDEQQSGVITQTLDITQFDDRFLNQNEADKLMFDLDVNNNTLKNLKEPVANKDAVTKSYCDSNKADLTPYLKKDGSVLLTGNLDLNSNKIENLGNPINFADAVNKKYIDTKFISKPINENLNLSSYKIINLSTPTDNTDAINKSYCDANVPDLSPYLKHDGTVSLTGNLDLNSKKIINLNNPILYSDAVNKKYVDTRFIEKPIIENLNMQSYKIVNVANPDNNDAVNIIYADNLGVSKRLK